jgi:hypothetical protein
MDLSREKTNDDAKEVELHEDKEDEPQVMKKARSGQTTKQAPRLTLKAETQAKPI